MPRGVHSRCPKRMEVIRYCSAWPTSQATIVQPRAEGTGVSSADGPKAEVSDEAGDAGLAFE